MDDQQAFIQKLAADQGVQAATQASSTHSAPVIHDVFLSGKPARPKLSARGRVAGKAGKQVSYWLKPRKQPSK